MLTKMEVFSSNPSAPELPLGGFMPSEDPVQVRSINGLEPVTSDISSTKLATGRGEQYQGSTVGKRNIVLTLGLNPDWIDQTMSTLRQKLYGYFMPQAWTKLRFYSDYLPVVDIEGYVESFDANMFSQDPEIQVSVICPKPDFIEANATLITGVVDDGTLESVYDYVGTVDTGFEMRIERTPDNVAYSGAFTITNVAEGAPQIFEVDPVTVDATKYFKLSTVPNAKRVGTVAVADGAVVNLLDKVDEFSVWPKIKPGENVLSVAAGEPGQAWTFAYFNRFGGL